jgi:hypothetical protein
LRQRAEENRSQSVNHGTKKNFIMMDNPKLFFLVKKILSSSEPGNQYNNFDPSNSHVVNELVYVNLLKNHREYQRKNQSALKKAIEIAVGTVISNSTPLGSTVKVSTPTALAPKHKRRREEEEEEEEGGIPSTETMPKGRIPTTTTTGNGNMLNATICANYQEIQKKKEQQSLLSILEEEQAEEVNTDENVAANKEKNVTTDENNVSKQTNKTVKKKTRRLSSSVETINSSDVSFTVTASERPKARFADLGMALYF